MPDLTVVEQQRVRNIQDLFFSIQASYDIIHNTINTFLLHNFESQHLREKHLEVMDELFSLDPHFADDETLSLNDFIFRIKNFINNQDGKSLIEHFPEISFPPGAGGRHTKSPTKTKRRKTKRRKTKRRKTRRRKTKRRKTKRRKSRRHS
jgi:hypothetical protein